MAASQAEGPPAPPAAQAGVAALYATLGRRQLIDLALPGLALGLLGGAIAGGLAAAGGLALDVALFAGVSLGVPLALAGAAYELLLARGRVPLSVLTPVVLFWAIAYPIARVLHAALLGLYAGEDVAVPDGWLSFVVYQVLLSLAFGIGYWWLHENFAPRWWYHLRDRNPVANSFIRHQLQYAAAAEHERQQRSERKSAQRPSRR